MQGGTGRPGTGRRSRNFPRLSEAWWRGVRSADGSWKAEIAGIETTIVVETAFPFDSTNGLGKSIVWFEWSSGLWLRVVPDGLASKVRKLFGTQDIETGDTGFDRLFLIQGKPEERVKSILSAETRRIIAEMSTFNPEAVSLDLTPRQFVVSIGMNVASSKDFFRRFLTLVGELFLRVRSQTAEMMTSLGTTMLSNEGICLVCGGPFADAAIACPKCRTPHHQDCWTYFGGCAVYACGSRQVLPGCGPGAQRPRRGRPKW
ncbi:MAG: hypothetical protein HYY84_05140 [Deltaproteobacteria bacterium]|nr:hypothetical protein [Deltaproteobacteria bacterium]